MLQFMQTFKAIPLFLITALFEIMGCYLFFKFVKEEKRYDYFSLSVLCLIIFAWLLTFHLLPSGRLYAAYGGIYIAASMFWLNIVDKITLSMWDITGLIVCIFGALIIYFQP